MLFLFKGPKDWVFSEIRRSFFFFYLYSLDSGCFFFFSGFLYCSQGPANPNIYIYVYVYLFIYLLFELSILLYYFDFHQNGKQPTVKGNSKRVLDRRFKWTLRFARKRSPQLFFFFLSGNPSCRQKKGRRKEKKKRRRDPQNVLFRSEQVSEEPT